MDLARAVAGDVVANLENLREIGAGALGRIVFGFLDAGGRWRQNERLREGVRLDDGGRMCIRFRFHAEEAEAVIEAHGSDRQADAAAERASECRADGFGTLWPDTAGEGHVLRFAVQLVFQADAAGNEADRKRR